MKIKGVEEVAKELKRLQRKYPEATAAALYTEGLRIERASVPLVPVDTGRLRATHYVSRPAKERRRVRVYVGYGANYGLYVHERTSAKHTTGQAKFLEQPFKAAMAGYSSRMAAEIKSNADKGKGMKVASSDTKAAAERSAEKKGSKGSARSSKAKTKG